jgi:hypothetical protein
MFLRKVSPDFPDTIIKKYIYEYSKFDNESFIMIYLFFIKYLFLLKYFCILYIFYIFSIFCIYYL